MAVSNLLRPLLISLFTCCWFSLVIELIDSFVVFRCVIRVFSNSVSAVLSSFRFVLSESSFSCVSVSVVCTSWYLLFRLVSFSFSFASTVVKILAIWLRVFSCSFSMPSGASSVSDCSACSRVTTAVF